jgi:hypothetical protein
MSTVICLIYSVDDHNNGWREYCHNIEEIKRKVLYIKHHHSQRKIEITLIASNATSFLKECSTCMATIHHDVEIANMTIHEVKKEVLDDMIKNHCTSILKIAYYLRSHAFDNDPGYVKLKKSYGFS